MEYQIIDATTVQEGVWDEKTCIREDAGISIDKTNLPANMAYLPKGSPIGLNQTKDKAVLVKTAEVFEDAAAGKTIKVGKRHALVKGDIIGGNEVTAIDSSNANYDVITIKTALTAENVGEVKKGVVLSEDVVTLGLNYATVKLDSMPSCTPTVQAYKIDEASLPYPINDKIKGELTHRHHFKRWR